MSNVVSRSDLRWLLDEWNHGRQTAAQVHDWAEARFAVNTWICEDDIANEVLAELDTLDMNLLTSEDIHALYAMLDLPRGEASLAHDLLRAHFAKVSLDARKKKLAADPTYARFCRQKTITIDCAAVHSEEEFWAAYVDAIGPDAAEFFGRNLDAFWDAVSAGGPGWPGECELRFVHALALGQLSNGHFLAALKKIAGDSPSLRISFDYAP